MAADPPFLEWRDPTDEDIARFKREYKETIKLLKEFIEGYKNGGTSLYPVKPYHSFAKMTERATNDSERNKIFVRKWYAEVVLQKGRVRRFVEYYIKSEDDKAKYRRQHELLRKSFSNNHLHFEALKNDGVLEMMYREPLFVILQIAYYVILQTSYRDYAEIVKESYETLARDELVAFPPRVPGKTLLYLKRDPNREGRRPKKSTAVTTVPSESPANELSRASDTILDPLANLARDSQGPPSRIVDPNAANAAYEESKRRAGQAPSSSAPQRGGSPSVSAAPSRSQLGLDGSYSDTSDFGGGENNDNGEDAAGDSAAVAVYRVLPDSFGAQGWRENDVALEGFAFASRDSVFASPPPSRLMTNRLSDLDNLPVSRSVETGPPTTERFARPPRLPYPVVSIAPGATPALIDRGSRDGNKDKQITGAPAMEGRLISLAPGDYSEKIDESLFAQYEKDLRDRIQILIDEGHSQVVFINNLTELSGQYWIPNPGSLDEAIYGFMQNLSSIENDRSKVEDYIAQALKTTSVPAKKKRRQSADDLEKRTGDERASKRARSEASAEVLATVKALHSMRKEDSVRKRQNRGR